MKKHNCLPDPCCGRAMARNGTYEGRQRYLCLMCRRSECGDILPKVPKPNKRARAYVPVEFVAPAPQATTPRVRLSLTRDDVFGSRGEWI